MDINEYLDLWGEPRKYKGIAFYPLKIKEMKYYTSLITLFGIPKNYIQEKKILKMSYMKYILVVIQYNLKDRGIDLLQDLTDFLKYVTRRDDVSILVNSNSEKIENLLLKIKIGDIEFSEYEFDDIRKIILGQNGLDVDFVEEYVPDLEEKLIFLNGGRENMTFEEEVFSFASLLGKSIFDIQDYTLYQFKKHFERILLVYNYKLFKPLEFSGSIKVKDGSGIRDYLSHIETKGRYSDILISKDKYLEENSELFNNL